MLSMTGFGKGDAVGASGLHCRMELSAVNRKQFELRFSAPAECAALEQRARNFLGRCISRGALQLRLSLTRGEAGNCAVNEKLLGELISAARNARKAAGLPETVAVEQLMLLPGVVAPGLPDPDDPELVSVFDAALENAWGAFLAMRRQEGGALYRDLLQRVELLESLLARLEEKTAGAPEAAKKRLLERLENAGLPVSAEDPALLKEVLFYVDRSDVAEEITRLHSHFVQFRNFLEQEEPCGRSLDFLTQELFREINTLGNKALLPGVSPLVVQFKSELEKIREQIQNVE